MPSVLLFLAATAIADPGSRRAPVAEPDVIECTAADGTVLGRHRWTHVAITQGRQALCDVIYPGGRPAADATCSDLEITAEQWARITEGVTDAAALEATLGADGPDLVAVGGRGACARVIRIKGKVNAPTEGTPVNTTSPVN